MATERLVAMSCVLVLVSAACGPEPEAATPQPSAGVVTNPSSTAAASADASASASAAGAKTCESLARSIASAEARLVKQTYSCTSDADCACYGGPNCPNAIADVCPKVIGVGAQRELASFEATWREARCEGYAWSPSMCEPSCRGGICVSLKRRRELTDAEQADRCGYKGNQICCLGPPGIKPPPKPMCHPAD